MRGPHPGQVQQFRRVGLQRDAQLDERAQARLFRRPAERTLEGDAVLGFAQPSGDLSGREVVRLHYLCDGVREGHPPLSGVRLPAHSYDKTVSCGTNTTIAAPLMSTTVVFPHRQSFSEQGHPFR